MAQGVYFKSLLFIIHLKNIIISLISHILVEDNYIVIK